MIVVKFDKVKTWSNINFFYENVKILLIFKKASLVEKCPSFKQLTKLSLKKSTIQRNNFEKLGQCMIQNCYFSNYCFIT